MASVRYAVTRILALAWPELRAPDADPAPWERMLDALDDLSPRVEAVDLGVALVDVTGLGPLWGSERRIAARAVVLTRPVAPLRVRCGIGPNRWLASLAARLARFERPDAPAAFRALETDDLRHLPLDLLPADAATRQRFARFGLTTMAQLADLPRSAVGAQFGTPGERLQVLARGHDPRPIVPRRRPERVARRATFEPPLDGVGTVGLTLRRLAAELCDRLRARHLAPGRATLTLVLEHGPPIRVAQAFPQPVLEPDWIARLLLSRLEAAARARSCLPPGVSATEASESASGPRAEHGKSVPQPLGPADATADASPHAAVVGIWQESPEKAPVRPRTKLPPSIRVAATRPMRPTSSLRNAKNLGKSAISSRRDPFTTNLVVPRQLPTGADAGADAEADGEPRVASVVLVFDRLVDPAATQLPAFEARAARWEELRWSLERIRHRFGDGRLWRAHVERPRAALPEHRSRLVDIGP